MAQPSDATGGRGGRLALPARPEGAEVLPRAFFDRDPRRVARALLGKLLVRRAGRRILAGRVVETEAYLGTNDPAAHAAAGCTPRNRVLFGPPGHAYVYLIFGNHYCLNVSCLPEGEAGCVLFRALEPLWGVEEMAQGRGLASAVRGCPTSAQQLWVSMLTSGPGRLTQAFGITRARDNGKDLVGPTSDLILADDGFRPRGVLATPRIGITKASEPALRYVIADNPFASKRSKQQTKS